MGYHKVGTGVVTVVEVDETKLGKRKYNKGHKVDGVWILAGIEHTERVGFSSFQSKNEIATL